MSSGTAFAMNFETPLPRPCGWRRRRRPSASSRFKSCHRLAERGGQIAAQTALEFLALGVRQPSHGRGPSLAARLRRACPPCAKPQECRLGNDKRLVGPVESARARRRSPPRQRRRYAPWRCPRGFGAPKPIIVLQAIRLGFSDFCALRIARRMAAGSWPSMRTAFQLQARNASPGRQNRTAREGRRSKHGFRRETR